MPQDNLNVPEGSGGGTENEKEETPAVSEKKTVVVCVYEGHEEELKAVWEKKFDGEFKIVSVSETCDLKEVLAELVADTEIKDDFVLVPADTVPCSPVTESELRVPVVYVSGDGEKRYDEKVPLNVSKDTAVELLADDSLDSPGVVKAILDKGTRPLEVGYTFGNYVTPVRRANPCEHIVVEALIRKKFLITSPEGFGAVKHLLK